MLNPYNKHETFLMEFDNRVKIHPRILISLI